MNEPAPTERAGGGAAVPRRAGAAKGAASGGGAGAAPGAAAGAPEAPPRAGEGEPACAGAAEAPAEGRPAAGGPGARPARGAVLRGTTVSPGLVLGVVHRKDHDLTRAPSDRVPLDGIQTELNRFRRALDRSRGQLLDLRARLEGRVAEEDARVLDTHLTYLKDSVFIADVENLVLNEQMRLEAAISKVVGDFDRIFRLVQNETLRQSAVDLRDVGIRVLRNLDLPADALEPDGAAPREYVLVARELSIVDMFDLTNRAVRGIATQEGTMTSHAAVLARSMRIPALIGVHGLLDVVREGDFVILDASEGVLRVEPDEIVRRQYAETLADEAEAEEPGPDEAREPCCGVVRTADGEEVVVEAACGNLPEVDQAARLGATGVGLYRTELLYLLGAEPPSREELVHHYASVVSRARGGTVTFRLLMLDSGTRVPWLFAEREPNPALGRAGIRLLLEREGVLRRQLQAVLMAGAAGDVRIALPFVTDCGELRRVKEILFEERVELRRRGEPCPERLPVGVVVETPAAALGAEALAREADFLSIALDALVQHLLAADREAPGLATRFERLHPVVLRVLGDVLRAAAAAGREVSAFGATVTGAEVLPFLVGAGLRRFAVPPGEIRALVQRLGAVEAAAAERAATAAARSACTEETRSLVAGYRHGYAPS